jgi:hypothetical protein
MKEAVAGESGVYCEANSKWQKADFIDQKRLKSKDNRRREILSASTSSESFYKFAFGIIIIRYALVPPTGR